MIKIICVGKIKESYLKDLIEDYKRRITKYHKLEIIEVKDSNNINEETREILRFLDTKNYNIALAINGKRYSSTSLAEYLNSLFIYNGTICFIIGGSNGLEDDVLNKCNELISFSDLTFPHGLFRGILLEQIYRSFKIQNNERYHK